MPSDVMAQKSARRLIELERVIERGHKTFIEVGTALAEVKADKLYQSDYRSFEAYCSERWSMSRFYAARMIDATEISKTLPIGNVLPTSEAQIRPLKSLPETQRAEAWKEASSDGKPTAAKVREVVDRKLATINGHAAVDPPDLAKARANGKIPAGTIVEVREPDEVTDLADVAEAIAEEAAQGDDALSDVDWLAGLPLTPKLTGSQLKTFQADALVYRELEKPRKSFRHHAARAIKSASKGAYAYSVARFLRIDHPKHWIRCPTTENGGCNGAGAIPVFGVCPKCHGRGFWIK